MDNKNQNSDQQLQNEQPIPTQKLHAPLNEYQKKDTFMQVAHAGLIVGTPIATIGLTALLHLDPTWIEVMKCVTGLSEGFALTGFFANIETETLIAHATTHWLDSTIETVNPLRQQEQALPLSTRSKILRKIGNILPYPIVDVVAYEAVLHQAPAYIGVTEISAFALLGNVLHRHIEEIVRTRRKRRREDSESSLHE